VEAELARGAEGDAGAGRPHARAAAAVAPAPAPWRERWGAPLLLALAFWALGALSSRNFVFAPYEGAVLWLPAGLSLGALLVAPRRLWGRLLVAVGLGEFLKVLFEPGNGPLLAGVWSAGNVLRTWLGAALMHRLVGQRLRMDRPGEVGGLFLLGAAVGCLPSALLGAAGAVGLAGAEGFWRQLASWWAADALGTTLLAPLLVAWWPGAQRRLPPLGRLEMAAALGLLALVADAAFGERVPRALVPALPWASFPLVVWAAVRLGPRGASAAAFVLGALAIGHTAAGHGPFGMQPAATPAERVLSVQAFLAVAGLTALTLAALAAERRRAAAAQRLLARAGVLLAESLDVSRTLPRVAALLVPEAASGAGLWLEGREGEGRARVARAGLSAAEEAALEAALAPPPAAPRTWVGRFGAALVVPMRGRAGALLGTLGVVDGARVRPYGPREMAVLEDLARRCALAVEAGRLMEELREAVAVRDEFLAVAAHELRTPLTALKLRLQRLGPFLRAAPEPERALASLHAAARQASRLTKLVEGLVDVGHIHTGRLTLYREEVDLARLVEEVAGRFEEEAERAGCTLHLRLEEGLRGTYDRLRVEQALLSLLSNAVKFGRGQPVEVELRSVGGGGAGALAHLEVRDQGIGVAPEALERIFGRFERAVSERHYGGLGLGLFLTHRIAEAHGGRIHVESRPGEGARFVLELPLPPRPADAAAGGEASRTPDARTSEARTSEARTSEARSGGASVGEGRGGHGGEAAEHIEH
jgi:signal transduction histidine kinase